MKYGYINSEESRAEVFEIGMNLADYVHRNSIPSLMFLDRSARAGYWVFRHGWLKQFPSEPVPNAYFTNPQGYERRRIKTLAKKFDQTYPKLSADKDSSILLVDVCMHSGRTLEKVMRVLDAAKYQNVLIALTQPPNPDGFRARKGVRVDFTATQREHHKGCNPFSIDWFVIKEGSLISSALHSVQSQHGRNIRHEIACIFKGLI